MGLRREAVINVQASLTDLKLLIKLEGTGKPLETLAEYSQGVIPYKTSAEGRANRYISANRRGRSGCRFIENASQVRRYDLDVPTAFIRYGRWLWCAREARFFAQPKILFHRLRKKLPRQLIGAYDDTGAINRHSLSNLNSAPRHDGDPFWQCLACSIPALPIGGSSRGTGC